MDDAFAKKKRKSFASFKSEYNVANRLRKMKINSNKLKQLQICKLIIGFFVNKDVNIKDGAAEAESFTKS